MHPDHWTSVRRICCALPETTEKLSHGEPTFFVSKRVFARFAIEAVTGVLQGRSGAFVLQHSGTQQLSLTVVPDSGVGELVGLAGHMKLKIVDGQHSYHFTHWFDIR